MELVEFLSNLAKRNAVSPTDELQRAAVVALYGYGVLRVKQTDEANKEDVFYTLKKGVKAFEDEGKFRFVAPLKNTNEEVHVQVDATNGRFASSVEKISLEQTNEK